MSDRRVSVAFVLEQHVGHRTYAENLRVALQSMSDVDIAWVPVTYGAARQGRRPLGPLQPVIDARREVRTGIASAGADVHVFNTQVPAALGGRSARARPYVAVTDVTPLQYDAMAEGYRHRVDRPGPMRWWKRRQTTAVFRSAYRCVGWSSWTTQSIVDDYGIEASRVEVIPPGVDTRAWCPDERPPRDGSPRILFVGGEFERKGGLLLLEATRGLEDRCEVWIVTKSAVPPRPGVHVVDDLTPNDHRLVDLYRSAAMFVLPSRAETFGIAALEASSVGLPVIASRVGGLADIAVDGQTGLTIPVGDAGALRQAITRLLEDVPLRLRLGAAARDRAVERYDSVRNATRLLGLAIDAAHAERS